MDLESVAVYERGHVLDHNDIDPNAVAIMSSRISSGITKKAISLRMIFRASEFYTNSLMIIRTRGKERLHAVLLS